MTARVDSLDDIAESGYPELAAFLEAHPVLPLPTLIAGVWNIGADNSVEYAQYAGCLLMATDRRWDASGSGWIRVTVGEAQTPLMVLLTSDARTAKSVSGAAAGDPT